MTSHLEDFTLLRYLAADLGTRHAASTQRHLRACEACATALTDVRKIDSGLRRLAATKGLDKVIFEAGDPFRRRPTPAPPHLDSEEAPEIPFVDAIMISRRAEHIATLLLDALRSDGDLGVFIARLSSDDPMDRYGLLYALQESGRRSAEYPLRVRDFAQHSIDWLRQRRPDQGSGVAERLVPALILRGHAHLALAIACLWTQNAARGRAHLLVAYRSFARGGADDVSLALVELAESQRRALSGEGTSALALARRSNATFEARSMSDYQARALNAEGLSHSALNEHEDAVLAFRAAQTSFESHGLWTNYVGALNGSATSLARLGRIQEARRDYARALRRYSSKEHRSWIGYLQLGLAETLFNSGRYVEAAASSLRAAGTLGGAGLQVQRRLALLLEIDSWARHGQAAQALNRLEAFRREIRKEGHAREASLRKLAKAISGADSSFEGISRLRRRVEESLSRSTGALRA